MASDAELNRQTLFECGILKAVFNCGIRVAIG